MEKENAGRALRGIRNGVIFSVPLWAAAVLALVLLMKTF